jgi:hypothetical protein
MTLPVILSLTGLRQSAAAARSICCFLMKKEYHEENIHFLSRKFPANADSFIASHFLLRYNAFKA